LATAAQKSILIYQKFLKNSIKRPEITLILPKSFEKGKFIFKISLVWLYNSARTYFIKNS